MTMGSRLPVELHSACQEIGFWGKAISGEIATFVAESLSLFVQGASGAKLTASHFLQQHAIYL